MKVNISKITKNPYNTREDFGDLSGLKESIKKYGMFQPYLVRKNEDGEYELIFGSRRLECERQLGSTAIDIELRETSDADMAILALCENVHRKDLLPVELAKAYQKGLSATKLSVNAFSKMIGESPTKISDYLGILELPDSILKKQEKYSVTQLVSLGKLQSKSRSARIMLENVLSQNEISSNFLKQIVSGCEAVYASALPENKKRDLSSEIISQDYSHVPPENAKDITTYADSLLENAVVAYQDNLRKTEKARSLRGKKKIKNVYDIVHFDKKIDALSMRLREAVPYIQRALEKKYYAKASKRSRGKLKTAVNHVVSGLEKLLKDGT